MAQLINLNKARKARNKLRKKAQADENAVKFGRSKAERTLQKTRAEKARRALDGPRRDDAGHDGEGESEPI